MNLVQIKNGHNLRRVALVQEDKLIFLNEYDSVFHLAKATLDEKHKLRDLIKSSLSEKTLDYERVYSGKSEWKLLPSYDHPTDPRFMLCSGTGLTHKASAQNRENMHKAASELTDSMKIYLLGEEGGKPNKGEIGVQPEWFYKGNGSILRACGEDLVVPNYANDGGEEPEIAACYINDRNGQPYRIGYTTANEFSDHVMEKKNYLYLAPSKIRNCAIGPELMVTYQIESISGYVSIIREEKTIWGKKINTGEANMAHSIANLEYHHFKYSNHQDPNGAHLHFFGADAFSFGEGISLQQNDVMSIKWDGFTKELWNKIRYEQKPEKALAIKPL